MLARTASRYPVVRGTDGDTILVRITQHQALAYGGPGWLPLFFA